MRILDSNEYINEKLVIQPVTRERLVDLKNPEIDDYIKDFIRENKLKWNPVTKSYDCDDDVEVSKNIVTGGKLKIRFGNVGGVFDCSYSNLTTLEGTPKKVGGYFDCSHNNLTSLEGAPQEVCGGFYCSFNKLTSLEGAPNKIGGEFACNNNKLTTLEGAPNEVCGDFSCIGNNLTNLEGAPKEVGGVFNCAHNNLTTIDVAPKKVGGDFNCYYNPNLILPKEKPSWLKGEIIS